ncbi:uncharacterized protein LOC134554978 isoform X4 [Prinia subflava]|uniref:uncharacterized protein LOC134554978 isoform X4 n=1 Tax=Prinia subflava TaxID=208062 RepID=UPI002FE36037
MSLSVCHQRGCEAVPEADLRKAFSALLMSPEQGAVCSQQRDAGCELEESELCSHHGVVKELLHLQEGPAAGVPHLPGVQEATCHEQGDATCKRFRCRAVPVLVLVVLVLLVLALAVALAVQSGIPAPGSRVRNGAPSSGPPWPLSRMRTWVCSSASAGTSITGSGCADGASACTGGTAATSAPGFLSLAIPSVCTWLTITSGVRTAPMSGRICAARPKLPCDRGCRKDLLHAGQSQLHLSARHRLSLLSCSLCLALTLRVTSVPVPRPCEGRAGCPKEKSLQSLLAPVLPAGRALPP